MAKPTQIFNQSTKPSVNLPIEQNTTSQYNSDTVSIISLVDAKIKVTGTVTGNQYVWDRAGTALSVDKRDVDELLNMKRRRACCSGNVGSNLFELSAI